MRTLFVHGKIYDSDAREFRPGMLMIDGNRIENILPCESPLPVADRTIDLRGDMLAPGLIDVHTHGRAGFDFNTADEDGMRHMAASYLSGGVTTLMPTLASATFDDLCRAADTITKFSRETDGAVFVGVHLEGRYLNPEKRGAHAPELLAVPDAGELSLLLSHMPVPCHVSAAFELDTDGSFARTALDHGATLGLAHTAATAEQAKMAFDRGVSAATHLFNAMPPLHHRYPGAACVALTRPEVWTELICDGLHIAPDMVALAYACKGDEKLVLITDSMEATGCADGHYRIAGMDVIVRDGKAVTVDGAIAGSTLSLLDGVRHLAKFCGISFGHALRCATLNPARMVGIDGDVGSLAVGKRADMLILSEREDDSLVRLKAVIKNGEFIGKSGEE